MHILKEGFVDNDLARPHFCPFTLFLLMLSLCTPNFGKIYAPVLP